MGVEEAMVNSSLGTLSLNSNSKPKRITGAKLRPMKSSKGVQISKGAVMESAFGVEHVSKAYGYDSEADRHSKARRNSAVTGLAAAGAAGYGGTKAVEAVKHSRIASEETKSGRTSLAAQLVPNRSVGPTKLKEGVLKPLEEGAASAKKARVAATKAGGALAVGGGLAAAATAIRRHYKQHGSTYDGWYH